ncbi:MAG: MFS transporter [Clostridiales bacterium]|nr:MFS transporter [Clostridiales bacterium]
MNQNVKPGQSARLLFYVTALFWCAQYSYTQYVNPELQRMGANALFMGLVAGAYGLTQMLLRIPLGIIADRIGRQKPFVVLGSLLSAMACAGFLLMYSPYGFLISRGLAGVGSASWVSFTVLYSAYFPHHEGPKRISHLNAANMSGRLVGFFLVLFIIPLLGVKSAFTFSLAAALLAFFLSITLKEPRHVHQGLRMKDIVLVARDKYLIACSIVGILTQVVAFNTYYGFTVNIAKRLGAQDTMLSWLNIAMLIPTILMNLLLTKTLLSRFSARVLVCAGFVTGAVYCVLVPMTQNMTQLLVLQILAGSSSTLTFGVLIGQSVRDIKQELRAVAMGFYQAVYGIGMTLGPVLMGVLIDSQGLNAAFFAVAGFALISGFLSYYLLNIPPKNQMDLKEEAYE